MISQAFFEQLAGYACLGTGKWGAMSGLPSGFPTLSQCTTAAMTSAQGAASLGNNNPPMVAGTGTWAATGNQFKPLYPNTWQPNTYYAAGDSITSANGLAQTVFGASAGTTGNTEPTFDPRASTTPSGTVIFTNPGTQMAMSLGDVTFASNANVMTISFVFVNQGTGGTSGLYSIVYSPASEGLVTIPAADTAVMSASSPIYFSG